MTGHPVWAVVAACGAAAAYALTSILQHRPARPALAVALGCCLASVAGCLAIVGVTGRSWRGSLLGLAAGIAYAGSGSLVKVTVGLVGHGIGAVVLDWPPYALTVIGALGLV